MISFLSLLLVIKLVFKSRRPLLSTLRLLSLLTMFVVRDSPIVERESISIYLSTL
jgi:hypothetical protein